MKRRSFVGCGAGAGAMALARPGETGGRSTEPVPVPAFELDEVTVADLQKRMAAGGTSARRVVEACLARIAALDRQGPELRSVIETNPEALAIAEALDAERSAKGGRGPLHSIPVLLTPQRRRERRENHKVKQNPDRIPKKSQVRNVERDRQQEFSAPLVQLSKIKCSFPWIVIPAIF